MNLNKSAENASHCNKKLIHEWEIFHIEEIMNSDDNGRENSIENTSEWI